MKTRLTRERFGGMSFAKIFPMYQNKILSKGKTLDELHEVIEWLTGYDKKQIDSFVKDDITFAEFIDNAKFHKNVTMIKGLICGHRVEDITDDFVKKVRYVDKLIDELARGKKMESILRK